MVNTIGSPPPAPGLAVHAELDPGAYPTGVTVADEVMAALPRTAHDWHGAWKDTLRPQPPAPPPRISLHHKHARHRILPPRAPVAV